MNPTHLSALPTFSVRKTSLSVIFFHLNELNARLPTAGVGIFKGGDMKKIRKVNLNR